MKLKMLGRYREVECDVVSGGTYLPCEVKATDPDIGTDPLYRKYTVIEQYAWAYI